MSKSFFWKLIRISLIFYISEASTVKDKQTDFLSAKRSLFEREREFIKSQPMSEDLRTFIEKYKRTERRTKRSQLLDENNLYIIHQGQLVPYNNFNDIKRHDEPQNEEKGFTVVPLIIPFNSKSAAIKMLKARNLNEEKKDDKVATSPSTQSSASFTNSESLESTPKIENFQEDEDDSNSTKEENQVLHKILEDVEGLMKQKHEGTKKEGVICNPSGSWISEAAGMRFDICFKNATRKKFRIHVADRIPPNEDGFLCDGNWTVFGELPFKHSGVIIVLAVHEKDKHIATFIGECRVCEGTETVSGSWLIGRSSRDCKDEKASHKILSDVWRRERGHILRKKHLQQIGYTVGDDDD